MTKRRKLVEQLPVRIQTQYRKKQFASTVDQVFQPGSTDSLTGYIGKKPSYYSADTDLYIVEPSILRQEHQLEAAMVSRDATGAVTDILSYDDFINYIEQNNGNVADHNRMFRNDYYTWSPPIDLDKLNNFSSYFWFGDNPALIPTLVLTSQPVLWTGNSSSVEFGIPDRAGTLTSAQDDIVVTMDGAIATRWSITSDETIRFAVAPATGSLIKVYRYGDLSKMITGNASYDPSLFSSQGQTSVTSGMRIVLQDALQEVGGARSFWIEGVGTSIDLVPTSDDVTLLSAAPFYVTIDRRSTDQNIWSRRNFWVHKNAFDWAGDAFPDRIAARPIIEFIPNLQLINYGTRRVEAITCKVSGNPLFGANIYTRTLNQFISDWDRMSYEELPYESSAIIEIPVANINTIGVLQTPYTIPNDFHGSIYVDAQHVLTVGDRLLVTANPTAAFNNCILAIDSIIDPTTHEPFFFAVVDHVPAKGDVVSMASQGLIAWDVLSEGFDTTPFEENDTTVEYRFNDNAWVIAQPCRLNVDPLFDLFDANGVSQSTLAGTTFTGSRIFGYASGDSIDDSVLLRPLAYDDAGEILFSNDLFNTRASTAKGPIVGFQYFKVADPLAPYLGNGWLKPNAQTSQSVDANGIWTIPFNLTFNPDNVQVDTIARSQWFAQFSQIVSNQTGFVGAPYALNNYRDTAKDRTKGAGIIQNDSPLLKAMLLASDENFDLFAITRYVDSEYARFRRKFYQQITIVNQNGTCTQDQQPPIWVSTILNILVSTKTPDSPFYGSSVAGGSYFIPPTPATMGLMPCAVPQIVVDNTYSQPVTLIVGHDGSRTPATNDFRDQILLSLEQSIYASIPAQFKDGADTPFVFDQYKAGWARPYDVSKNYSPTELASILSPYFIRWAQINDFDYTANTGYIAADPFTWNYNGVNDIFGAPVAGGNWRAIYRYFYDTDRPHSAPWEMLGFASKPTWFDAEYGAAPYTSGNTLLWDDIRDGRIQAGPRAGLDANYARPNLYAILPVDAGGALLNPVQANLIPRAPTTKQANANWKIGDHGPVENLWINSPAYPFAKCQAAMLMRPAEWIERGWATQDYVTINDQLVNIITNDRPHVAQLFVHGEIVNGLKVQKLGLQQWIVDVLASQGQQASLLGNAVRGLSVQLAHKMAGFTQQNNLRLRSDTFDLLPSEDIEVIYYEPAPFRSSFYSNIIIEWVGTGWSVVGYDNLSNTFKTSIGDPNGPKTTISLGPNPAIYNWYAGVAYPVGRIVDYKGNLYTCIVSHTSGSTFVLANWTAATDIIRYPQVQVYDRALGETVDVPYGTVFTDLEDVALFIRDYMRWLESEGWIFDSLDQVTRQVQNWNMLIRQYLEWTQITYVPGNFIALAPGASKLKFKAAHGQAYSLLSGPTGSYGIINRNGRPMPVRNVSITRDADITEIDTNSNDLAGARISLGEIEHVVLISNTTVFNDIIYDPLYNIRQDRLYIIGNRVANWTGRRDAPGYIIVDNDLMPSFEKAEQDIRYAFDIEKSEDPTLREYARHVIGYQSRPYLDNLLVDETEQFEFYQGMIQQKGTVGSFSTLARSSFIEQQADIAFLEEWAFRLSEYGATTKDATFSFQLPRETLRANPQRVDIGTTSLNDAVISLQATDSRWIEYPQSANVFAYVSPQAAAQASYGAPPFSFNPFDNPYVAAAEFQPMIPNAGYVRTNEVNLIAFRNSNLSDLYDAVKSGDNAISFGTTIWTYDRGDGQFDVLSAFYAAEQGNAINSISAIQTINEDSNLPLGQARVIFSSPHYMGAADIGLNVVFAGLTGTTVELEGVTQIVNVDSATSIIVSSSATSGYDYTTAGILGYTSPDFYVLRSMHFTNGISAQNFWSRFTPSDGQIIYIDNAGNNAWAVYTWSDLQRNWSVSRQQPQKLDSSRIVRPVIYDQKVQFTKDQMIYNPVALKEITVLDPTVGLLPGEAMRDITYVLDYDPARYNTLLSDLWGAPQVGQLWWDLTSVRFLVTETDTLYTYDDPVRTAAELDYRTNNWGTPAPFSTITVYEWTRSLDYPTAYTGIGTVRNATTPSYVAAEENDPITGQTVIAYYYWVLGQTAVPNMPSRNISAVAAATLIANPFSNDLPWIAPIAPNSFIMCNIEQYVSDDTTAFEVAVRDTSIEGVKHAEWQLIDKLDDATMVPEDMWKALRASLTGFDEQNNVLPSLTLQASQQVGYGPGKTLFSGGRPGMLAARKTFAQTINDILSRSPIVLQSPGIVAQMTVSSPTYQNLIWNSDDTRLSYSNPPVNSFTAVTTGLERRNAFMRELPFINLYAYTTTANTWDTNLWEQLLWDEGYDNSALIEKNPVRILVKNPNGNTPGWAVWQIVPPEAALDVEIEDYLTLAHNFDSSVATYAAMLTNTYVVGTRVLVENDENASGFWTVWLYDPTILSANSAGFSLLCSQTYRTSDFWSLVDWYSPGFTAAQQPTVHYATVAARDLAEGRTPTNLLVQIDNFSNGSWAWTFYDGANWNNVAHQNGTIALQDTLYNPVSPVFGFTDYTLANIPLRDGSKDLQMLIDVLRSEVLSDGQLNEVWFSMLHFMHSQQNQVDWAFKTSFMTIEGFNETLTQAPIAAFDNSQNLTDYVEEIKPYRVTIRDFTRTVSPPIDVVATHVTDFDVPMYYDQVSKTYRRLVVSAPTDALIMQSTLPYSDWYNNYLKTSSDPLSPNYNPVRQMAITMNFDRVGAGSTPYFYNQSTVTDGANLWDIYPLEEFTWEGDFSVTTSQRIEDFYVPTDGMANYGAYTTGQTTNVDGDGVVQSPFDIDGNATGDTLDVSGGTSSDITTPDEEELATILMDEAISMTVMQTATVGAPHQIERYARPGTKTSVIIDCVIVPASPMSVFVFFDGLRQPASEYTIDFFDRLVTIEVPTPAPDVIMTHVMGVGGITLITEHRSFDGDGVRTAFELSQVPQGYLEINVDGVVNATAYTLNYKTITFSQAPAPGSHILVFVRNFSAGNGSDTATYATVQSLSTLAGANHTYTIASPTKIPFGPDHVASLVEVNGARLRQPFTRYATFDNFRRATPFRTVGDVANLKIWISEEPYTGIIGQTPLDTPPVLPIQYVGKWDTALWDEEMLWDVEGDIVVYGDDVVTNNPNISGDVIIVDYEGMDYDVEGSMLTVYKALSLGDKLNVTTFYNADLLDIETSSFTGTLDGLYHVPLTDGDSYIVSVNGLTKTRGYDYEVKLLPIGFDTLASDEDIFGGETSARQIVLTTPLTGTDIVEVMGFTGHQASTDFIWHTATNRPSAQMMGAPILDSLGNLAKATSAFGPTNIFLMKSGWDMSTWRPVDAGSLVQPLYQTDATIVVQTNVYDLATESMNPHAFALPVQGTGVIWVEGERIEYTRCTIVDGIATLSSLRRATHGTSIGDERRSSLIFNGDDGTTMFTLTNADTTLPNADRTIEVTLIENGQKTALSLNVHYTVLLSEYIIQVTLMTAPTLNQILSLSQTRGFYHDAGTIVYSDNPGITIRTGTNDYIGAPA